MEIISSKTNPKIVFAIKLKQKKFREENKKVLLEGIKVIEEAVKSGLLIETIFVSLENQKLLNKFNVKSKLIISESLCKALSFTITSQNVFAVASFANKENKGSKSNVLVLDNLQNPDNLGAILRTAVATNFTTIYAINSVDLFNDKVIRSSMGNCFKVNFIPCSIQDVKSLKKNYELITADMDGENVFKTKSLGKNVALIIGNEGNGVSKELKELASKTLSIPMKNNVESLNASVSAGILMYEIINRQGE